MPSSRSDPGFYKTFLHLFVPAAIQNLFFNLIGIFDVLMIGQLGDAPVAAFGLAGQVFFLLNLTLFGIASGCSVIGAQYWGAGDRKNLHRILGVCLLMNMAIGIGFSVLALGFPTWLIGLYTQDPTVIALGASYLRVIGWAYLVLPLTIGYTSLLRATGNTRLPMMVSVVTLALNLALDYSLIFGRFGLPALGIRGSATGTGIARLLECVALLTLIYWKRLPVAASLAQLFNLDWAFILHHFHNVIVVFLNEFIWALGVNVYNAIFAHLGTQAYAALNIAMSFSSLGIFYSMSVMTACGIMVGNAVGAGNKEEAFHIGRRTVWISIAGSIVCGLAMILVRDPLMTLYQVSDQTRADATGILLIAGSLLWLRGLDGMFVVGILRSGGDTRFSAILDVGAEWLAGIPAVALAAFVFHLPIPFVFLAMYVESLVKNLIGLKRYLSKRWICNLTSAYAVPDLLPPL
jgi:putative MATE family efflux protein